MIRCLIDAIAVAIRQSIAQARAVPVPCSNMDVLLRQAILPHWQVEYANMPDGSLEVWGEDEMGAQWRIILHAV